MRELSWHDFQWCLKRTPRRVLELLRARPGTVFIGGGFVRAVIANEPVNDIDLFTTDKDSALSACRFLLDLKDGQKAGRKIHESDNAFTVKGLRLPIQIIHRWAYTEPAALMEYFDFTIAMAGFWWSLTGSEETYVENNEVKMRPAGKWNSICDPRFYEDLEAKRLRYTSPQRNEDAGGSMLRVLKFYQRGYRIPLNCLGAVVSRLVKGIDFDAVSGGTEATREKQIAKVISGLLREVDPNVDPEHIAHLPSIEDDDDTAD